MGDLVLIIDPEGVERRYIAAVLAGEGLDVTQSPTLIEGIVQAMAKGEEVKVIVLADQTDPVHVDDVMHVIRRVTRTPLVLVGDGDPGDSDALDNTADAYLARPFNASSLIARVRMLTRRAIEGHGAFSDGRDQPPFLRMPRHRLWGQENSEESA